MSGIIEFVENQKVFFERSISDDNVNNVNWEKESQFAMQILQSNDFLARTALSNPASAQNAIINIAAIGITLNPSQKLAYLVPRNGSVCLDISYMGLLHLAIETGSIKWGQSIIVYSNDSFKRVGVDKAPIHEVDEFGDRGEPVGAYCIVKTADGDFLTETMRREDIEKIRDRSMAWKTHISKGKPCPWSTDKLEMWRKTVVKRASKYWPKIDRLSKAIEYLNENGEGFEKEPVLRHYSESEIKSLKDVQDVKFENMINENIEGMNSAKDMDELKDLFKFSYKNTLGSELNKVVQQEYIKNKGRLNG